MNPARQFYDRISHAYDAIADSSEHQARETGLGLLAAQPGETILEIGYGTGHSLVTLAQAVGDNGKVYGVDISQGMHDVAAKRIAAAGVADRVEITVAEVPPLPYADAMFDAVTLSFTLELFSEELIGPVIQDIKRVLKPGGRVASVNMAVSPAGQHDSMLEKSYKWMHHHFPHIVDCRPIDAPALFEQAGLNISARTDIIMWTMPVVAVVGVKG